MLTCHPQFPQSWTIYLLWPLSILMIVDCLVNSHQGFSSYQIWSFFSVQGNEYLTGHLPNFERNSTLEAIHLGETSFSGELPTSIGNLNSLNELDIWSCNFSGLLPFSLGNISHLKVLDLTNNSFRGQVPSSLENLSQLTYLSLCHNNFSGGNFPRFGELNKLKYLIICNFNLNSQIPYLANLTSLVFYAFHPFN